MVMRLCVALAMTLSNRVNFCSPLTLSNSVREYDYLVVEFAVEVCYLPQDVVRLFHCPSVRHKQHNLFCIMTRTSCQFKTAYLHERKCLKMYTNYHIFSTMCTSAAYIFLSLLAISPNYRNCYNNISVDGIHV